MRALRRPPAAWFAVLAALLACSADALTEQVCEVDASGTCTHIDPSSLTPYASFILGAAPDPARRERPMSAKFVNLLNEPLKQYWDDGSPEGKYQGGIHFGESTHGTFTTHKFFFKTRAGREVGRFTMDDDVPMYIIHGDEPEILASERYKSLQDEIAFMREYKARTGQTYLSKRGRPKPQLPIWPADYVGQTHVVDTPHGYWNGSGYSDSLQLRLVVLATKPKVFLIENLLSEQECDIIVDKGRQRVAHSSIGIAEDAFTDDTRTSRTGWIERGEAPQINRAFRRFADVLGMRDEQLDSSRNAEPLQIVHYAQNQHYYNHYDFFNSGTYNYRFSTLLFYLNNSTSPTSGGGTGFPKAYGGKGLKLRPPKGGAVLFYSLLEDGNCDEMSEHTGLHVLDGEKWIANLWTWDPKKN